MRSDEKGVYTIIPHNTGIKEHNEIMRQQAQGTESTFFLTDIKMSWKSLPQCGAC